MLAMFRRKTPEQLQAARERIGKHLASRQILIEEKIAGLPGKKEAIISSYSKGAGKASRESFEKVVVEGLDAELQALSASLGKPPARYGRALELVGALESLHELFGLAGIDPKVQKFHARLILSKSVICKRDIASDLLALLKRLPDGQRPAAYAARYRQLPKISSLEQLNFLMAAGFGDKPAPAAGKAEEPKAASAQTPAPQAREVPALLEQIFQQIEKYDITLISLDKYLKEQFLATAHGSLSSGMVPYSESVTIRTSRLCESIEKLLRATAGEQMSVKEAHDAAVSTVKDFYGIISALIVINDRKIPGRKASEHLGYEIDRLMKDQSSANSYLKVLCIQNDPLPNFIKSVHKLLLLEQKKTL